MVSQQGQGTISPGSAKR